MPIPDIQSLFREFRLDDYVEFGQNFQRRILDATGDTETVVIPLVTLYVTVRLLMDGSKTVQIIQNAQQNFGISRYHLWRAYKQTLERMKWKLVEHCTNTCKGCHYKWESLMMELVNEEFVSVCSNCGHHAIIIVDVTRVPEWIKRQGEFTCSKCREVNPYYFIEYDPFRRSVLEVLCPNCTSTHRVHTLPKDLRADLESFLWEKLNSILYRLQQFFDLPEEILAKTRSLLDGIDLLNGTLFKLFAGIEIAKRLLHYQETVNYEKYLRSRFHWGSRHIRRINEAIKEILDHWNYKIVEDKITMCPECHHIKVFLKEGERIICPKCFNAINYNQKFTNFSEVDLRM